MTTKLDKPLKREIVIRGKPFVDQAIALEPSRKTSRRKRARLSRVK